MRVTRTLVLAIVWLTVCVAAHGQDDFGGGGDLGGGLGPGFGYTTLVGDDGGSGGLQQDLSPEIKLLRRSHADLKQLYESKHARPIPAAEKIAHLSSAEEQLHRSLSKKSDFDFNDEPLDQFAKQLQEDLGVNVALDKRALDDEDLDPTQDTIHFKAKGMSYRAALNHSLSQLGLAYTIEENLLTITTEMAAEEKLSTRTYVVSDLISLPTSPKGPTDYYPLVNCITDVVVPNSWEAVGGNGSIRAYKGMLTIAQTGEIHEELQRLQDALRKFPLIHAATKAPEGIGKIRSLEVNANESKAAIRRALEKEVSLSFEEDPFSNVIEKLAGECGITILTDDRSLQDESFESSAEVVTFEIEDMPASTAFKLLLDDFDLTYVIQDEAVVVTSQSMAESTLRTRLYDCRPLIDANSGDRQRVSELVELVTLIQGTIAVNTWDNVGGSGCIKVFAQRGLLVISNTDMVHEKIIRNLDMLLRGKSKDSRQYSSINSEGPADVTVMAYRLGESFQDPEVSDQLVNTITKMMSDSDNAVNGANRAFYVRAVGESLVISHRRDAQDPLFQILLKMNALDHPIADGFATPPSIMMGGMGTGKLPQGGMGGGQMGGMFNVK